MTVTLTFSLPIPPVVNKLWAPVRTKRGARFVKRAHAADWCIEAATSVRLIRGTDRLHGPFAAVIEFPETRADIDARIKPLLDACQDGGAITNDRDCRRLVVEIDPTMPAEICRIHITQLPPIVRAPRRTKGTARKETTP
jgi:Holliday junction resolvase RusA-like endonuclease